MIADSMQTANLVMRPFSAGDGPAVYAYWKSDVGWEKYNESVPFGFTEQHANDFVMEMRARDRVMQPNWALVYDGVVMGVVSLSFNEDHHMALLGYGIHAELRGRGLVIEAVTEVLDCAFAHYPELDAIQALTDAENAASIRVLGKLGFVDVPEHAVESGETGKRGFTFRLMREKWVTRTKS